MLHRRIWIIKRKTKTEKKGKYVVKDGEGNIISQNMPKEFEDMIDLIFQEAKEKSKKARKMVYNIAY